MKLVQTLQYAPFRHRERLAHVPIALLGEEVTERLSADLQHAIPDLLLRYVRRCPFPRRIVNIPAQLRGQLMQFVKLAVRRGL